MPKILPNTRHDTAVRTLRRILKSLSILGTEPSLRIKDRLKVAELSRYFQEKIDAAETGKLLNKAEELTRQSVEPSVAE